MPQTAGVSVAVNSELCGQTCEPPKGTKVEHIQGCAPASLPEMPSRATSSQHLPRGANRGSILPSSDSLRGGLLSLLLEDRAVPPRSLGWTRKALCQEYRGSPVKTQGTCDLAQSLVAPLPDRAAHRWPSSERKDTTQEPRG